jgi:hypothetical protein
MSRLSSIITNQGGIRRDHRWFEEIESRRRKRQVHSVPSRLAQDARWVRSSPQFEL